MSTTPDMTTDQALTDENAIESPVVKVGRGDKIKVLAFVGIVVILECVVAFMFIPDSGDMSAIAQSLANEEAHSSDPDMAAALEEIKVGDQVEDDLGKFSMTSFQPMTGTTLRIDFQLFGTVSSEDEGEFLELLDENLHRFREQVIVTVRSADMETLTDPNLGQLKRLLRDKINRLLGKNYLQSVVFSDFSFIEQ